jgi:nucleoside-diphosphate-sugar epimerase
MVQAILLASETNTPSGEIFFVSDGHDYRLEEIGDILSQAMGIAAFQIPVPRWMISGIASLSEHLSKLSRKPPLLSKGKVDEMIQPNWVCDITKAKTRLGYEPRIPLPEGAKLTFEWYKKENWL